MAVVRPNHFAGMTLIEVMVVLLLISLTTALATGVVRSWQNDGNEADRLALVLGMAGERARVRGTPMRFQPSSHAYRFSRLDTSGNWQVIDDDPAFAERELPVDITLTRAMQEGAPAPEGITFGSDVALFSIDVVSRAGTVRIAGEASGSVDLVPTTAGSAR